MEKLEKAKGCGAEELQAKIDEVLKVASEYRWLDKRVMPYGYGVSIKDLLNHNGIDNYTYSSREIVQAELNGLIDIMNIWIEQENEEKVIIRMPKGSPYLFRRIPKSMVDDFEAMGAVVVNERG